MKKIFIKYAPILIAITAIADRKFDLLIQIGLSKKIIGIIELSGLMIALVLPSIKETININSFKTDNTDPQNPNKPSKPR